MDDIIIVDTNRRLVDTINELYPDKLTIFRTRSPQIGLDKAHYKIALYAFDPSLLIGTTPKEYTAPLINYSKAFPIYEIGKKYDSKTITRYGQPTEQLLKKILRLRV